MKRILFICYFFPPKGGIAVQRPLRYVKHLPEFGWQPFVLTIQRGIKGEREDKELLELIPKEVRVFRTNFINISVISKLFYKLHLNKIGRYLDQFFSCFPPDPYIGWLPFCFRQAKKIIKKEKIDIIYTVSAPYSAHIAGYLLKKQTGKPWIADFRDEWGYNPFRQPVFRWQKKLDNKLEKIVYSTADHIVVAHGGYKKLLTKCLLVGTDEKVTTITNGFEKNDFRYKKNSLVKKFRVVYTGSFYGAQKASYFLAALEDLLIQGQIQLDDIEVIFVGRTKDPRFCDNRLNSIIKNVGFVSHKKSIQYLLSTSILLLIVASQRGSGNIPGKTFEYIVSEKPILALVPPNGAAAEIVQKTRTGIVVASEDVSGIKKAIMGLYSKWRQGRLRIDPDWEEINKYEGRELTIKLSCTLNKVLDSKAKV